MPNHDGGHYFLTVLAPVLAGSERDPVSEARRSHRHLLARRLSLLPTGEQTLASRERPQPSPLARNGLNHLARFVIIDGPAYNGRVTVDTLVDAVRDVNPLAPQPIDRLATPYLLFAADIDAPGEGADAAEAGLQAYTEALWTTMEAELRGILRHCVGGEAVSDAASLHAFLVARQVETTMPFNDYWPDGMALPKAAGPGLPLRPLVRGVMLAVSAWLVLLLLNGILVVFGADGWFPRLVASVTGWGSLLLAALAVAVGLAAALAFRHVMRRGAEPFPAAPGATLPEVLKALFVQQHFTRFAIEAQGLDDAELFARFGAFLRTVRPAEPEPTQAPGTVAIP